MKNVFRTAAATMTGLGAAAGFGFGIFAAVKNFDPMSHQSASMGCYQTQYFSEILDSAIKILAYTFILGGTPAALGFLVNGIRKLAGNLRQDALSANQEAPIDAPYTPIPIKNNVP